MNNNRSAEMSDFLHMKGYNYFNMNRLTIPEINRLITQHNKVVNKKIRDSKSTRRRR